MNCNVILDLMPLYIDGCCSEESEKTVKEHMENCDSCRRLFEDMKAPNDMVSVSNAPVRLSRINDWKASVLQSVLLLLSFGLITIGVALEAKTPYGLLNGFWAGNIVIPATGFLLSLANWYFVRLYKSRKSFSIYSMVTTLGITICAYVWAGFHYEFNFVELLVGRSFTEALQVLQSVLLLDGIGFALTAVFCVLSLVLSDWYGKMLGKE